jgi:DNA-binding Xre family transcriptional regulator
MSATQIKSYFSRKASKLKNAGDQELLAVNVHDENTAAAEDESAYYRTRNSVMDECQLEHPITYESINLCQLLANKKMNNLSISLLKSICEELDLDASDITSRRKAPFIERISTVIQSCSCFQE